MAIGLMVIYHFSFDLSHWGVFNLDLQEPFLWFLPRLIVFLFFFCAGMSLVITHDQQIQWRKFFLRLFKLILSAIVISFVTYFVLPQNWIFFGTLHSLSVASLLGIFLVTKKTKKTKKMKKRLTFILGMTFMLIPFSLTYQNWFFTLPTFFPFSWPQHQAYDYVPLIPWTGALWLGIAAEGFGLHHLPWPKNEKVRVLLAKLSKYSLPIYLLHQPFLYAFCFLLSRKYSW